MPCTRCIQSCSKSGVSIKFIRPPCQDNYPSCPLQLVHFVYRLGGNNCIVHKFLILGHRLNFLNRYATAQAIEGNYFAEKKAVKEHAERNSNPVLFPEFCV